MIRRADQLVVCVAACVLFCAVSLLGQNVQDSGTGPADKEPSPPEDITEVERRVAKMIDRDAPFADCHRVLGQALAGRDESPVHAPARTLLADLRSADRRTAALPVLDSAQSTDVLIQALPLSRLNPRQLLYPQRYYEDFGKFMWEYFAARSAHAATDPAFLLHGRGREIIPQLVPLLDDTTVTRTAVWDPQFFRNDPAPCVFRVCDVAYALIEAVSLCRFRDRQGRAQLVSNLDPAARAEVAETIRAWWDATRHMTQGEALVWQAAQLRGTAQESCLLALEGLGEQQLLVQFLLANYRNGTSLNWQFADRLIEMGIREPLDDIHRRVQEGGRIDETSVRLLGVHGDSRDIQLLMLLVADDINATTSGRNLQQLVFNGLQNVDHKGCLPVYVAGLVQFLSELDAGMPGTARPASVRIPTEIDIAARRVQALSEISFGYDTNADNASRLHVIRSMVAWWQREGRSAYGFSLNQPHAPSGIR